MAKSSAARRLIDDQEPPVAVKETGVRRGRHRPSLRSQANAPVLNNAKLGVIMMLGAEAMFFAGLIGAFIVFRLAAEQWPPPFQPRLPVGVTGVNTLILLISAVTMHFSIKSDPGGGYRRLQAVFDRDRFFGDAVSGNPGLRMDQARPFRLDGFEQCLRRLVLYAHRRPWGACARRSGLALVVYGQARKGRYSSKDYNGLQICGMYWTFVVALWPALYGLVYLY